MDYSYLSASNGSGDAALMHVTAPRLVGATTIEVDSVANVPTKFIGTAGTLLASGFIDSSIKTEFKGHLSVGNIIIDSFEPGSTDIGNTEGQVVVIRPNTSWANDMAGLAAVSHNDDGTIKDGAITASRLGAAAVTASKIDPAAITLGSVQSVGGQSTALTSPVAFVGGTPLTWTGTVPGSRRVEIEVYFPSVGSSITGVGGYLSIWEDSVGSGTQLTRGDYSPGNVSGQHNTPMTVIASVTPTAGTHTYVVGIASNTTQNCDFLCSGTEPALLTVKAF